MTERIATRLHVPEGLALGATAALTRDQVHRLRNVLRLGSGAVVAAFNEEEGEWRCTVAELGRNGGALTVAEQTRGPETEPTLSLVFAPIKRLRLDWLIEKATELGVTSFVPVVTARTQGADVNVDRLAAIATAAAEQCGRLSVPGVLPVLRLDNWLSAWPQGLRLLVCDETGGGVPIAEGLAAINPQSPAAILIGPEGGFDARELDALGKLPNVTRVGLGPRVLRAETAALAAVAAFQAIAGDWRRVRPR
jgi:16S rRNA (uracil1498-N3)-methyltransferase